MKWVNFHITVPAAMVEALSELLMELGAAAVSARDAGDEAIFEPPPGSIPVWQRTELTALFPENIAIAQIVEHLKSQLPENYLANYSIEHITDQNWQQLYQTSIQPVCFANRLWLVPSWHQPPQPSQPFVILDPGIGFGTGSHPTTALCLEWLATSLQPQQTLIDYGCGSGILALAAVKLGAKHVFAVDNEPQALKATRENAKLNQIAEDQLTTLLPEQLSDITADVVIANIIAKTLIELASTLSELIKPKGQLILSGILVDQAQEVMAAYSKFKFSAPTRKEEWVRLDGVNSLLPLVGEGGRRPDEGA